MSQMQHERHILVLGSSGKLGRMLRRVWRTAPPGGVIAHWQIREKAPGAEVSWRPGDPPPQGLPAIAAVLALWGTTPASDGDLADNRRLALAAMELAQALGADRVLHCSSAAVYPPGPDPLAEDAAGGAVNPYGAAKLDMEATLADWARTHPSGPQSCAMRIANVAGADSLFAALAGDAAAITLHRFADGRAPRRSYISPAGLARAFETLLTCPLEKLPGKVNIASPTPLGMDDIARAAGRAITWADAPPGAAPLVWLDTARLGRLVRLADDTAAGLVAEWRRFGEPA